MLSAASVLPVAAAAGAEISAFLFNQQFVAAPRRSASAKEPTPSPAVAGGKVRGVGSCGGIGICVGVVFVNRNVHDALTELFARL